MPRKASLEILQQQSKLRHLLAAAGMEFVPIKRKPHEKGLKRKPRIKKTKVEKRLPDINLLYHLRQLYDEGVKRLEKKELQKQALAQMLDKIPEPKKIIRAFKEPPVQPDEKKSFVRPPAVYTNSPSPYGIADELHELNKFY